MRIFVLGNSHAGALRLAIKRGWSAPGLEFDFLAIPGRAQPQVEMRDGRLFAAKSAKLRTNIEEAATRGVDISQYDVILFSAWGVPALVEDFRSQPHPLSAAYPVTWPASSKGERPAVSEAVMRELIAASLRALHGFSALVQVVSTFKGPIFVQPRPKPRRSLFLGTDVTPPVARVPDTAEFLTALYGADAPRMHDNFLELQQQASERLFAAMSPRIAILKQPVFEGDVCSVPDDFSISATDDHKGAAYGALVLNILQAELEKAKIAQPNMP